MDNYGFFTEDSKSRSRSFYPTQLMESSTNVLKLKENIGDYYNDIQNLIDVNILSLMQNNN